MRGMRVVQVALLAVALPLVGYVAWRALRPAAALPYPFDWFGRPAHWPSVAIVALVVAALCTVTYLLRRNRSSSTVPVAIVIGLLATSVALGFASFWSCRGDVNTAFFTPLEWTSSLIKGGTEDRNILVDGTVRRCPATPPVALNVARLLIFASFVVGAFGVAAAAFRIQTDRMRAWLARSVTAVVGFDDAGVSMITAITRESSRRGTLVLLTAQPDGPVARECRAKGGRVLQVDFDQPESMGSKRFWRKVVRLFLLSPDPSANLSRLRTIDGVAGAALAGRRVPLIVRIDDPWLAMAWRAEQYGGADTRWAGDAVGTYEVTARRLLDQIVDVGAIDRVLICGASQLTLALCADMSRRQLERDYHPLESETELPRLTLVSPDAKQYLDDHQFQERARGFGTSRLAVDIVESEPSETLLQTLVDAGDVRAAAIFVDTPAEPVAVTRLAARLPELHVYAWDPGAGVAADAVPITGRLRTYRLGIDLPAGQAHDNWERAAMLIHERFVAERRKRSTAAHRTPSPASVPWAQLDPFYRESNRRQVRNALRAVEQLAGHTWNTWGDEPDDVTPETLRTLTPMAQLEALGFTEDAVLAMAQAEFEDWSRHYRADGWSYGPVRDYVNKKHEKLVADWDATVRDEELLAAAIRSLATTLIQLRELGYRSRPKWKPFRRVDDVVVALARRARAGEVIVAPEGRTTAHEGDWVVMGDTGEQRVMSASAFEQRYSADDVTFVDRLAALKELGRVP